MEEKKSVLESLGLFIIVLLLGSIVQYYVVVYIEHLVKWYEIPISLSTKQWFGIILILGIIFLKMNKEKSGEYEWWEKLLGQAIVITVLFPVSYLISLMF